MFAPVVAPVLEAFCRQYPGIEPDVQLDDRIGNWVEDRVDVGFRIGSSAHEGCSARRLFRLQSIICATPEYLQQHGAPSSLDALASHRCSGYRHPEYRTRRSRARVKLGGNVVDHPIAPAYCTNDEELELRAVFSGAVIAQLTSVTAAQHIRSGRLIPLLTRHVADHASYFIYYGSRASQPARAKAFIELTVHRLLDSPDFVLSEMELAAAERKGRKLVAKQ